VKADAPSGARQAAAAAAETRAPMGAAPAARKAVVDGAIAKKYGLANKTGKWGWSEMLEKAREPLGRRWCAAR